MCLDILITVEILNSEEHCQSVNYKHCVSSEGDQSTISVTDILNENVAVLVTEKLPILCVVRAT